MYSYSDRLQIPTRKLQDLKLAFAEFYLSLVLLQNYQSLNFTGFRKILKKHDKVSGTCLGVIDVRFILIAAFSYSFYKPPMEHNGERRVWITRRFIRITILIG